MTSTSTSSGYSLSRNSSKVIQPPGGRTADIFGRALNEEPSSASSLAGSDVASSQVSQDAAPLAAASGQAQVVEQQQQPLMTADDFKPVEQVPQQQPQQAQQANIPYHERTAAQQAKMNVPVRRNPITGEILEDRGGQPAVVRVRQPPGGRSSGIF